jgi:hypothetical protein
LQKQANDSRNRPANGEELKPGYDQGKDKTHETQIPFISLPTMNNLAVHEPAGRSLKLTLQRCLAGATVGIATKERQSLPFQSQGLTLLKYFYFSRRPVTAITVIVVGMCFYHQVDATFLPFVSDTHFEPILSNSLVPLGASFFGDSVSATSYCLNMF